MALQRPCAKIQPQATAWHAAAVVAAVVAWQASFAVCCLKKHDRAVRKHCKSHAGMTLDMNLPDRNRRRWRWQWTREIIAESLLYRAIKRTAWRPTTFYLEGDGV